MEPIEVNRMPAEFTEKEKEDFYYRGPKGRGDLYRIHQKIFEHALTAALPKVPADKRAVVQQTLTSDVNGYAGSERYPDHLVFLPEPDGKHHRYLPRVISTIRYHLGENGFEAFSQDLSDSFRVLLESYAERKKARAADEKAQLEKIGNREVRDILRKLNPLERRLVDEGKLAAKSNLLSREVFASGLHLNPAAISPAEGERVKGVVQRFARQHGWKLRPEQEAQYIEAYGQLKTAFQLFPNYVEHILGMGKGSIVFIDRDARPLYYMAAHLQRLKGGKRPLHLIPVSRDMIPASYTAAHMAEKGGGVPFQYEAPRPGYAWTTEREMVTDKQEEIDKSRASLEEARSRPEFQKASLAMLRFLKHTGALRKRSVLIVDMGMRGSSADFLADAIRQRYPDKKVRTHLYYSRSNVPGFIPGKLPHVPMDPVGYARWYEDVPKDVPPIHKFTRKTIDGTKVWIPEYGKLRQEERRWIHGLPNEVSLGTRLVHEALVNLTLQHVHGLERAERQIERRP